MRSFSIIIATYNRAAILRETLLAMTRVDRAGVDAEWIVINNNSTDATDETVLGFKESLPILLLHEPKPGKNRALNRAIDEVKLKEFVIFADDDIIPKPTWLHEFISGADRWPKHSVFGSRILPRWPPGGAPKWIDQPWLLSLAFAQHDLGEAEHTYPRGSYPYGPSFCVRKAVFDAGMRYRESIGPIGSSRIMGSETSFLKDLEDAGYGMVYCPATVVEHCIKPNDLDPDVIARRALSYGRGRARIRGLYRPDILRVSYLRWKLQMRLKLLLAYLRVMMAHLRTNKRDRMDRVLRQRIEIGSVTESLRMAAEQAR